MQDWLLVKVCLDYLLGISFMRLIVISIFCFLMFGCATQKVSKITFDHKAVLKEMKVENLVDGSGPEAEMGDRLDVRYVGKFENGKVFDNSDKRGHDFSFHLGKREVIPAWDAGLVGMKKGGKRRLAVPPKLAYGARGVSGVIPPNSVLIFEVEVTKITQD